MPVPSLALLLGHIASELLLECQKNKNDCNFNQLAYESKISLWCRLIIHEEEKHCRSASAQDCRGKVGSAPTTVGGQKET